MQSPAQPWPAALQGTPAVEVIGRAISQRRLGHSLLLHGDDLDTLSLVARAIADRLLCEPGTAYFPPEKHPDCFSLRPSGKSRQISADATRGMIANVQKSASVSPRKVAIVHEADRMNLTAANIFLKTLEEPPANTTLLLLTSHPYALLPTIRSRCLHFRFSQIRSSQKTGLWSAWLSDYGAWLSRIESTASPGKQSIADHIFSIYGLVARFGFILDQATDEAWKLQKESLPADVDEDQQVAIETGLANGIRARFFADLAEATRIHSRAKLESGDETARRAFTEAIGRLEHGTRLLRLNLNESAVLEDFLLASLRLWSGR